MKAWRKDFTLLNSILTCFLLGELVFCSEAQGILLTSYLRSLHYLFHLGVHQ